MFRIDRNRVSFDSMETAYTSIGDELRRLDEHARRLQAAAEEKKKADSLKTAETELAVRLSEAEKSAGTILSEARARADEMLRTAADEAKAIREEARSARYAQGVAKAEEDMVERCRETKEALENIILRINEEWDELLQGMEEDVITLVLDTAKKIVNVAIEKDENTFVGIVQGALAQTKLEGRIVLRVSKAEYMRLFSEGGAEFFVDNERVKVVVIEEPLFEDGDCVIESEGETVNAGVNSQFRYIEAAFRDEEGHIA